ncbi:MAG: hypothetical protein LBS94_05485 [Prevotellaceae bacterium]|jgi:glycerophosphoryl diester phosphodiesterase|nr:hypothetical protein [Prevotellaceae bacterium]
MKTKKSLFFALCMAASTVALPQQTKQIYPAIFDEQAHRGGRGLMPENTIPAMLNAIDLGVVTLELDLQISKDLKVVVSHEGFMSEHYVSTPEGDTLSKTEARERLLYHMPYDSIAKYDVGLKPHPEFPQQKKMAVHKPLLDELIKAVEMYATEKGRTIFYNMEIKSSAKTDGTQHPSVEQFVDLAVEVIRSNGVAWRTTIQSFDTRALKAMHQKYPDISLSYLVGKKERRPLKILLDSLGFVPPIFSPEHPMVTPEMLSECHALHVRVVPWTPNTVAELKRLRDMGVDGIITDFPNLFDSVRTQKKRPANNPAIAHRGAWKNTKHPQNSIAALRAAVALKCYASEFDIQLTADDSIVVNHDADFKGVVIEKNTFAELRTQTLDNGEPLPSMREYLAEGLKQSKNGATTKLIIDVKMYEDSLRSVRIAQRAWDVVREMKAEQLVEFIVAYQPAAVWLNSNVSCPVAYLGLWEKEVMEMSPEAVAAAGFRGLDYRHSHYKKHPEWLDAFRKMGLLLNVWTMNSNADLRWCIDQKFDYITTNEPEKLLKIWNSQ